MDTEEKRIQADTILMLEADMAVSKRVIEIMGANMNRLVLPYFSPENIGPLVEQALRNDSGLRARITEMLLKDRVRSEKQKPEYTPEIIRGRYGY